MIRFFALCVIVIGVWVGVSTDNVGLAALSAVAGAVMWVLGGPRQGGRR